MAGPTGGGAINQNASKINKSTALAALGDNEVDHVQAQQEQTGMAEDIRSLASGGCADGVGKSHIERAMDSDESLLRDKASEKTAEERSVWRPQSPGMLTAAMRAPWNMDVVKASRLSKAQWLQAHEAILLQCGFLVCLDGHANEPRDAFHPITPKGGASTIPPEFTGVRELHEYLTKQSMPLAVRKLCQKASPSLYAAAYPDDALGLPTQPSLPDVDDIDSSEAIIHLQVPFVALALVLQHHVKVIHAELSFELDPIPGPDKCAKTISIRRGPHRPKKTKPIVEKITVPAVPDVAEDMKMGRERRKPTPKSVATTLLDLEQARKLIPIKYLLETTEKGTDYASFLKIAKSSLVSTGRQVHITVNESQAQKNTRKAKERIDLTKMAERLVEMWFQDKEEFFRKESRLRNGKTEKAARNREPAARNAEVAGPSRREEHTLRRLAESQEWLERSVGSDSLESRIRNLDELRHDLLSGYEKAAELDEELRTLKDLQSKREKENQKAFQRAQELEAELSRLRELRTSVLQDDEGATSRDLDHNEWETKTAASYSSATRRALKGESSTQMNKRKTEDTQVAPAVPRDRLNPHKRARYEPNPRCPEETSSITSRRGIFHDSQLLQHGAHIASLAPPFSYESNSEGSSRSGLGGHVERQHIRPDHNSFRQHLNQESQLAVPQAHVRRRQ
ncbi:hypothetical protein PoMZ_00778 [Pyricularia oryzae]|uniref:Uncharacterized protein n=1 Tax=Pyricularia oryzae TaxID=318829 RepID=A0A4P7N318_PYROR|nr:hypothetical protein PoMZ_00778 [Pyricularia oryzae]